MAQKFVPKQPTIPPAKKPSLVHVPVKDPAPMFEKPEPTNTNGGK